MESQVCLKKAPHSKNYIIKNNKARLRKVDELDMEGEAFIIYSNSSKLLPKIIRKSILNYEYGSQCVFVYYKKRQKQYTFYLDQRIEKDNFEITLLYENAKKKWAIDHEKCES